MFGLKNFIAERGQAIQNSIGSNGVVCWATSNSDLSSVSQDVTIYPNPANNKLNIQTGIELKTLTIFDLMGHRILQTKSGATQIDISGLAAGFYVIEFNGKIRKKFVKE